MEDKNKLDKQDLFLFLGGICSQLNKKNDAVHIDSSELCDYDDLTEKLPRLSRNGPLV